MRFRWITGPAAVLAGVLVISGAGLAQPGSVSIGAPAALSGPTSVIGKGAMKGIDMALDELNAKGGLLGMKVEAIKADDAAVPATASTIVRNMILAQKIVAIFGSSTSATAAAEEDLSGQHGIPIFFYGGNDISLTTTHFNKYAFQLQPSTYMEPRAIAQYLAHQRYKRVYTIAPDYNFGHDYVDAFLAGMKEQGARVEVVGQQWPKLGAPDFSPFITAALAAKPDFVFLGIFGGDLITFIKQAKGYGLFDHTRVGAPTATDLLETLKGDTPAGIVTWGRAPFMAINTPAAQAFVKRYYERYSEWPSEWPILAYSAIETWVEGVRKAKSFDGAAVSAGLAGARVSTIRGTFEIRTCDHQAAVPPVVGTVAAKVNPQYGFPTLDRVFIADPAKIMMSCGQAQALQPK